MMRVLRLCSVFGSVGSGVPTSFDPVGGMQTHTAELTRALDAQGVSQIVVTTRPRGLARVSRLGERARVWRLGLPVAPCRQFYAESGAVVVSRLAAEVDLVHAWWLPGQGGMRRTRRRDHRRDRDRRAARVPGAARARRQASTPRRRPRRRRTRRRPGEPARVFLFCAPTMSARLPQLPTACVPAVPARFDGFHSGTRLPNLVRRCAGSAEGRKLHQGVAA